MNPFNIKRLLAFVILSGIRRSAMYRGLDVVCIWLNAVLAMGFY